MSITKTFDDTTEEIIKPSNFTKKIDGFPETVIVTFSERMFNVMLKNNHSEVISSMVAGFEHLIYKTEYSGKEIAFYMSSIGGPVAVGLLEEVLEMGGEKILIFGSCGSLDNSITDGHIVIPTHAYRDEGTSYHYVSPDEGEFIEVKTAKRTFDILQELSIPAIYGKTWTTDAIYRETRRNMELRKKSGCITVEMECASVMALAQLRNVDIYQFLYTADNLDCEQWEARLLFNMPDDFREMCTKIAFEVAARL
ncbi:MAG: nucleoside phosphorylase [Oscillospiraceae bacterium]|jgi:uridine phosphorylase|nr:nucleoside phosphorylase [Oscillospiraceae bacterium]